jgi:HAE1 family hydrophobic/amphiphilic exporter-1
VFCLDRRNAILLGAVAVFALSLWMTRFLGKEFVPPEDQSQFIVRLEAPIDYSVDSTDNLFRKAEAIVKEVPEITRLYYSQGGGRIRQVNRAVFFITLSPKKERKRPQQEIMPDIRKQLLQIPGLKATRRTSRSSAAGSAMIPSSTPSGDGPRERSSATRRRSRRSSRGCRGSSTWTPPWRRESPSSRSS